MVVKQYGQFEYIIAWFENGVISYGGQTNLYRCSRGIKFENGVISYGGQTC